MVLYSYIGVYAIPVFLTGSVVYSASIFIACEVKTLQGKRLLEFYSEVKKIKTELEGLQALPGDLQLTGEVAQGDLELTTED